MPGSDYTILLYHGVYADYVELGGRNASGKHMSRSRFESEMAWLAKNKPVVSLQEIIDAHNGRGEIPDGSVAVTFDDGFDNNYTDAWPVMEQHGIPVTIYLATGFIGSGKMVWSDRLEAALLSSRMDSLELGDQRLPAIFHLSSELDRQNAFLAIKTLCKTLPDEDKESLVSTIERKLEPSSLPDHPLYCFMTWDRVREMNASALVEFGAHTIDHVSLPKVSKSEMQRQIDQSVEKLETELQQHCQYFSYPEGQPNDVSEEVINHLKLRGFDHAPMAVAGTNNTMHTDLFHLNRTMVGFENMPFPFESI